MPRVLAVFLCEPEINGIDDVPMRSDSGRAINQTDEN